MLLLTAVILISAAYVFIRINPGNEADIGNAVSQFIDSARVEENTTGAEVTDNEAAEEANETNLSNETDDTQTNR